MDSFEHKIIKADKEEIQNNKQHNGILKYFWEASVLNPSRSKSMHNFLRQIKVLQSLSDYELRIFSTYLHKRTFEKQELIFKEGDSSFGFYLIWDGKVNICSSKKEEVTIEKNSDDGLVKIVDLSKYDYFGEFSLIEPHSSRNATAYCDSPATLLALFKPDLDDLIEKYPVVAAKLLRAVSLIVAKRFINIADELKILKNENIKLKEIIDGYNQKEE